MARAMAALVCSYQSRSVSDWLALLDYLHGPKLVSSGCPDKARAVTNLSRNRGGIERADRPFTTSMSAICVMYVRREKGSDRDA